MPCGLRARRAAALQKAGDPVDTVERARTAVFIPVGRDIDGLHRRPIVTFAIIAICTVVFAVAAAVATRALAHPGLPLAVGRELGAGVGGMPLAPRAPRSLGADSLGRSG